ncbi:M48 family metallopeptidase [Thalassotalea litorea]|uniref:M48 family metallopeptidase n=2 Tax=Thalassotalea litorea TaxID=2020715 RepID=A0A5R9IP15_9GAMM|nr:M48 family metallopeptidase [Thalassotalea litorea]
MLFSKKPSPHEYMDDIEVVRSNRRKTISLQVKACKVRILCPYWVKASQLQAFIEEKRGWIDEKLTAQRQALGPANRFWLAKGEHVYIQGQFCEIFYEVSKTLPPVALLANEQSAQAKHRKTPPVTIHIDLTKKRIYFVFATEIPESLDPENQLQLMTAFNEYCQSQAQVYFIERLAHWQKITGLQASGLKVRYYKSRWGSCDSHARITLNNRLVMAPQQVLDYVIVHELCHITHQNHSAKFWSLVGQFFPEFQKCRYWLKQHQSDLLHN